MWAVLEVNEGSIVQCVVLHYICLIAVVIVTLQGKIIQTKRIINLKHRMPCYDVEFLK